MLTRKYRIARRGTFLSVTSNNTIPVWTALGKNPGLCGKRPASNRLIHGTAPQM